MNQPHDCMYRIRRIPSHTLQGSLQCGHTTHISICLGLFVISLDVLHLNATNQGSEWKVLAYSHNVGNLM